MPHGIRSRLRAVPQDGHTSEEIECASSPSGWSRERGNRAKRAKVKNILLSPILPSLDSTEEGLLAVYKRSNCNKMPSLKGSTVEPRFNEVPRDWGNMFIISRVHYIEHLDLTNF